MNTEVEATERVLEENERVEFLPDLFDGFFLQGEGMIYRIMGEMCAEYDGGYWEFIELSNGGKYMYPVFDKDEINMKGPMNYSDEDVSPKAAGIVVTLTTLSNLSFNAPHSEKIVDHFYKLREYAFSLPEARKIAALID